jgi:hypothetical protein
MKLLDVFVGKEPSRNRRQVKNVVLCYDYLQLLAWMRLTVCIVTSRPSLPTTLLEVDFQN